MKQNLSPEDKKINSSRRLKVLRQIIYVDDTGLPDDFDLAADLPILAGWSLDISRTRFLRKILDSMRDVVAWQCNDPVRGELGIEIFFRSFCGYDLAFDVRRIGTPFSSEAENNKLTESIFNELGSIEKFPYNDWELCLTESSEIEMDLSGLDYPVHRGRRELFCDCHYTADMFIDEVKEKWLSTISCNECGLNKICRFPSEHPNLLWDDNKHCDVAELGLTTTVRCAWPYLTQENDFQAAIDALYHFTRFREESVFATGRFISNDIQKMYYDRQPSIMLTDPVYQKKDIDGISTAFSKLDAGNAPKVILVEGASEKVFLDTLFKSDHSFEIVDYKGKGNSKNIRMLISNYQKKGYQVFYQGDLDGEDPASPGKSQLIVSLNKQRVKLFMFSQDFESAFPLEIFISAVAELVDCSVKDIRDKFEQVEQNTKKLLHELNLKERKTDLARLLAKYWHYRPHQLKSCEIQSWLESIRKF